MTEEEHKLDDKYLDELYSYRSADIFFSDRTRIQSCIHIINDCKAKWYPCKKISWKICYVWFGWQ